MIALDIAELIYATASGTPAKALPHWTPITAGLTQADLPTKAGVSRKAIGTVENSVFIPSTPLALALGRVLGVSLYDLFELTKTETDKTWTRGSFWSP